MGIELGLTFLFSLIFLLSARKVAKKTGLVDRPDLRKRHQGLVPLAGGISVYASIIFSFTINHSMIPNAHLYLICAGVLVIMGILDDRYNISICIRAIVQGIVALAMMKIGNLTIKSLGFFAGSTEIFVGPFSYLLTLCAVWAAINAFNMVDGIDGLLGGLSCVTFGAMGIVLYSRNQLSLSLWCFTMIAAILPYILLNIGLLGLRYKVFMGDAGSTLIGFTVIWILLNITQGDNHAIAPVTALWVIAIPLMDMVAIMYRRLRKGLSPFTADRQHIHHLIMRAGFSPHGAFVVITVTAAILAGIGLLGEYSTSIPEHIMMLLFLLTFALYGWCLKYAWRISLYIRRLRRRIKRGK